jgi:acetolactate synthase I/II/III large subunit
MRVADYIIKRLIDAGTNHVFMVTGRGALFLNDAVAANNEIIGVSMHHEQAAAFAAVSYAQYNERMGACLVSTGCAGTNALTGVLNAWQDGIPCIFVSGQHMLGETSNYTGLPLRTYGQQEADIIPIVESVTKYAVMITDPEQIAVEMDKAFYMAQNGRKGPAWIDVPLDIQNMRVDPETLLRFSPPKKNDELLSKEDIQFVCQSLMSAERPVVLIGSGIRSANSAVELETFLKSSQIPVVYSASAPDVYGLDNPLSIGSVGIMGSTRAGNFALQNSDLLLVLGCRLSSMIAGADPDKFARKAKVIVVDIDKVEHAKGTVNIDHLIHSDLKVFLSEVNEVEINSATIAWQEKCMHWKKVFPRCEKNFISEDKIDLYDLTEHLSEMLPEKSVVITDSGLIELILPNNIIFKRGQRSLHPSSQGSMGYALPAIVGAHYSSNQTVIAVIGDGSIMMNLQEFETIRYHNIPAKIIVVNNNVYGVIRKRQVELFRSRTIGVDPTDGISCPNFENVARAFNLSYMKIEDSTELQKGLNVMMEMKGPVLCEIMGREDQDYISISHTRDSNKRFVRRPIEDQAPFLDRQIFLSEMLVEPIDQ